MQKRPLCWSKAIHGQHSLGFLDMMAPMVYQGLKTFFKRIGQYNRVVEDYKKMADTAPDAAMAYVSWGIEGINLKQSLFAENSPKKLSHEAYIAW